MYIIWDTTCGYMHMYVCAVRGSRENQSHENSTCMKSCQRNIVSFTQCVHMHKSVRVTVRTCYFAVKNTRPNSSQVVHKLSGCSIKNKEKFSQMEIGDVST